MKDERSKNIVEIESMARLDELSHRLTHGPIQTILAFERMSSNIPAEDVPRVRTELLTKLSIILDLLVSLHGLSLGETSGAQMDHIEKHLAEFDGLMKSILKKYHIESEAKS